MTTENEIIQQMDERDNALIQTVLALNQQFKQQCGRAISDQLWVSLVTMRSELMDRLWVDVHEKIVDQLCFQSAFIK